MPSDTSFGEIEPTATLISDPILLCAGCAADGYFNWNRRSQVQILPRQHRWRVAQSGRAPGASPSATLISSTHFFYSGVKATVSSSPPISAEILGGQRGEIFRFSSRS